MNHALDLLQMCLEHQDKKIKYCSTPLALNSEHHIKLRIESENKKLHFQQAIDLIKKNQL
jgi:hypothetical protein